jgi:hypothetical protein
VLRGNKCVALPRKLTPKTKLCTLTLGTFTNSDVAGVNKLKFPGRLNGRRPAPGHYALSAVAKNSAGALSKPLSVTFKVIR